MPSALQRELRARCCSSTVATMRVALQPALALQLAAAHQQHARRRRRCGPGDRRKSRGRRRRRTRRPCRSRRSTTVCASRSGCVDPQLRLMLRPSGAIADDSDASRPELLEQPGAPRSSSRRWRSRSASRTSVERGACVRKHGAQMIEIRARQVARRHRLGVAAVAASRSCRRRSLRPRARRVSVNFLALA